MRFLQLKKHDGRSAQLLREHQTAYGSIHPCHDQNTVAAFERLGKRRALKFTALVHSYEVVSQIHGHCRRSLESYLLYFRLAIESRPASLWRCIPRIASDALSRL